MLWRSGPRWWRLWWGRGLFLLPAVVGCGNTVRLGHGEAQPGGGGQAGSSNGGSTPGVAGTAAGSSETSPGEGGTGGEPVAQGGAPGTGDYRFYLVAPLPPPAERPPNVAAVGVGTQAEYVSDDGSFILGSSSYWMKQNDGQIADSGSEPFYWTRAAGSRPWGKSLGRACVSPDASVVLGTTLGNGTGEIETFRWTEQGGFQTIASDATVFSSLDSCSSDGKIAAGSSWTAEGNMIDAAIWRHDEQGGQVLQLSIPGVPETHAKTAQLSPDGSAVLIHSWSDPNDEFYTSRLYRSTPESGVTPLDVPPGYVSCRLALSWSGGGSLVDPLGIPFSNRDASMLLGYCYPAPGAQPRCLRWTLATGQWTPLPADAPCPSLHWMSDDGLELLGMSSVSGEERLVLWKDGQGALAEPNPFPGGEGYIVGAGGDGRVAYLNFNDSGPSLVPLKRAMRWEAGKGMTPLEILPGDTYGIVHARSPDGRVAAGLSVLDQYHLGRVVVWDDQGVRDVFAELEAAGIDVSELRSFVPHRVWAGERIVVQGTAQDNDNQSTEQTWFAELPRRD